MSGSSPGRALAATAPSFEVVFIDETGTQRREPLSACWDVPFERAKPSRSFPSFKGQKNFPGLWWSATMGEHVGYESWVERDVAMLLDFDPEIVGFSAQPFWLLWSGEEGERKHAPDFFARRTDGTGVVIDVRPDDRVDPEAARGVRGGRQRVQRSRLGVSTHRRATCRLDGQRALACGLPEPPLPPAR